MALGDFLTAGQTLPTVQTSQISSTATPAYFQEAQRRVIGGALDTASQPYTPYTQQRLAAMTPDQLAAFQNVRGAVGQYQPAVQTGIGYATQAGAGFDPSQFQDYMNPYTEGVVDRIATLGTRNLSENILPQVQNNFVGSGGFGGGRHEEFTARAMRDANESILSEQAKALSSGYDQAMGNYQAAQNRSLQAGIGLGNLANTGQTYDLTGAAALEGVGQSQQADEQRNLDLGYQDFLTQQQYPQQQLSWVNSILSGSQQPTTTTSTTTAPGTASQQAPSALGQIAGAGLGIFGLGRALDLFAKGGEVSARKTAPMKTVGSGATPGAMRTRRMQPRTYRDARAGLGSAPMAVT